MTQEQIERGRIAIAERLPHVCGCDEEGEWRWGWPRTDPFNPHMDLNAMHEAEMCLDPIVKRTYVNEVSKVMFAYCGGGNILMACFATAPQRFEAMLKTIGKWEE